MVWHDVLLRLWFLVGGGVVAVHHVGRNVHHLDLLSIVRRGLQLVVALLLCQWVVRGVCVFVFLLLFRHSKVSRFSGSLLSFCLVVFCRDGWYLHWFELFLTYFFFLFFFLYPRWNLLQPPSEMDNVASMAVYFGYSFLSAVVLFIMCGAVGFTATYIFVRTIFAAIKVD